MWESMLVSDYGNSKGKVAQRGNILFSLFSHKYSFFLNFQDDNIVFAGCLLLGLME